MCECGSEEYAIIVTATSKHGEAGTGASLVRRHDYAPWHLNLALANGHPRRITSVTIKVHKLKVHKWRPLALCLLLHRFLILVLLHISTAQCLNNIGSCRNMISP